ncbi:spore coat protein [Falsibacillus pallidus]|uniref:spore coat protein n=1 Tax=Falsibacillus pallidus TaxID=493781 RepID=UPI003D97C345
MPNNIEERGLTEREMLQLCLELEKARCHSITDILTECANEELCSVYRQSLDNAFDIHRELFNMLNQKGWYKVLPAQVAQIEEVQNMMRENLNPDHE